MCGKKSMSSAFPSGILPPIQRKSILEDNQRSDLEMSTSITSTSSPKRVRWDREVRETVPKKLERVRSRHEADSDELIWWSHLDERQFRKDRDHAVLNLLQENPFESRCHLRQFSLRERRSAANEYIRRILSDVSEEDGYFVSRSSSFSTGSSSNEEYGLAKSRIIKTHAVQDQLQDAWGSILRLIRSRGRGVRRR